MSAFSHLIFYEINGILYLCKLEYEKEKIMKKKIFLVLALAFVLCCIFVISANAQVTTYDDAPVKTKIQVSTDDVVVFDDGFCCPSGYIFKDNESIQNGSHSTPGLAYALDFAFVNGKTGKTYGIDNIVELDFPEGIETIGTFVAYNRKSLKKVTIPYSVKSIGSVGFQNATSLEECVFEGGGNPELTVIGGYMFGGCSSLKAFSMPDSVTTLAGVAQFGYCTSLTALYFSKNLTTIESGAQTNATFDGCTNLYFVNNPFTTSDTAEPKPHIYYFPKNLSSISKECIFRGAKNLNDVLVFGEGTTSVTGNFIFQHSPKNTVVFLGDMVSVDSTYWGTATLIFANKADKSASDIATLKTSQKIYYCYAEGNTNHLAEKTISVDASCGVDAGVATYCFCGYEISKDAVPGTALSHDYDYLNNLDAKLVSIIYANYSQKGVKTVTCANCKKDGQEDVAPLFDSLGYSAPENGNGGVALGYLVNNAAIDEYEAYTGKSVKYGVFAVLQEKLGDGDVFAQDGTVASGAITAEISTAPNIAFEIKVTGFTSEQKDVKIAMGAYVALTDGQTAEYSYMQAYAPNQGEKYSFASFNDIVNSLE